ncbi:hypothetical protein HNQ92_003697 [Rhabdobacter roseus]|uniref:Uncharacterized protein n=1 Tax=Rhabdobacter roseus TaxID=1655419 RepID=A0A840U075_9BACT|nr:hypothetical protein [Rhabdobacter roseus]
MSLHKQDKPYFRFVLKQSEQPFEGLLVWV